MDEVSDFYAPGHHSTSNFVNIGVSSAWWTDKLREETLPVMPQKSFWDLRVADATNRQGRGVSETKI